MTETISGTAAKLISNYRGSKSLFEVSMVRLGTGDRLKPFGSDPGAYLTMSQRFQTQVGMSRNSLISLKATQNFTAVGTHTQDVVTGLIAELAISAAKAIDQPAGIPLEQPYFNSLKTAVRALSTQLFDNKQIVNRDVLATFDSNTGKDTLKFWTQNGQAPGEAGMRLDSSAIDANGNSIDFDSSKSFVLDAEGKGIVYISGSNTLKKFNFETNTTSQGTVTVNATSSLFLDAEGKLWLHNDVSNRLEEIDSTTLGLKTAYAGISMLDNTGFSVQKEVFGTTGAFTTEDVVTFVNGSRNIDRIRLSNLATLYTVAPDSTTSAPPGEVVYGAGDLAAHAEIDGVTFVPFATNNNTISPAGRFAADIINTATGTIRLFQADDDSGANHGIVLSTGSAQVSRLQINQDENRVYYVDGADHTIKFIGFTVNDDGTLNRDASPTIVVQGENTASINGLTLVGTNPGSNYTAVGFNGSVSSFEFSSMDFSLYKLGLNRANVDTQTNAEKAFFLLQNALTQTAVESAGLVAAHSRISFIEQTVINFTSIAQQVDSDIRSIDTATEVANASRLQVQHQTAASILSTFNQFQNIALILLPK